MQDQSTIFALDIGTRSVVGLIIKVVDGMYQVIDILSIEHSERSMVDGQIHDVLLVSKVITEIKTQLEAKHGTLQKVCVAAAGRALKTEKAKVTIDIKQKPMIFKEDILHLELSAVQQAQFALATKHDEEHSHHYYCVGYSVMHYQLDGEEIGNLMDQQGGQASVEIIATFLPRLVVESLLAALQRSGLEMEALTLEPIAAINVLIPPSMRRLNVALVDIGAGTSDIAITDEGTVVAYGMVPVAGDEITEAISDEYLLDFPLAEIAKRDLHTQESITIQDILGFESKISKETVIHQISDSINLLANSICQEILRLNKKPPKAVMLVGGGSLTPELPKRIANMLELPENRVAIRGIDAIQNLQLPEHFQKGPELVTPIGIAIAANRSPVQYLTVYVNERPIRLFDMKQLTVGDSLLASGIKLNKLYGRPGLAIMIKVNDQDYTLPGNHGLTPKLLKNGEPCTLDEVVHNGDRVFVEKGTDGLPPIVKINELLDEAPVKNVTINGTDLEVRATILRNNSVVSGEEVLLDHDCITYHFPETIEQLLLEVKREKLLQVIKPFQFQLNGRSISLSHCSGRILKNGAEVQVSSSFENGDQITTIDPNNPTVQELAIHLQISLHDSIPIFFRREKILLTRSHVEFVRNGETLQESMKIEHGDSLQTIEKKVEPFIFQDLFRFIDLTIPTTGIKGFKLLRNEEAVTFHEPLVTGDKLDVVFDR
ncbi:pilus assembly protein PilM [Bacillus sp. DJP31]|uniref:pilus assembly protein PilM n=1 Tax=Bacillus sp. DJP31 TaxID=3409789 RepID=UPI003BB76AC3